jgi:hypothetical protein
MHADQLKEGSRLLDRVGWCLGDRVAPVSFLASLTTADARSSLPIRFPPGVTLRPVSTAAALEPRLFSGVAIPDIAALTAAAAHQQPPGTVTAPRTRSHGRITDAVREAGHDERLHWRSVFEYIGSAACGVLPSDAPDGYVSTMDPLGSMYPTTEDGIVATAATEALFPAATVAATVAIARLEVDAGRAPWAAVVANSWPDAPSSRGSDKFPEIDVSSDLVVLVLPAGRYATLASAGVRDSFST